MPRGPPSSFLMLASPQRPPPGSLRLLLWMPSLCSVPSFIPGDAARLFVRLLFLYRRGRPLQSRTFRMDCLFGGFPGLPSSSEEPTRFLSGFVHNTELSCVGCLTRSRTCRPGGILGVGKTSQEAECKTTSASTTCYVVFIYTMALFGFCPVFPILYR